MVAASFLLAATALHTLLPAAAHESLASLPFHQTTVLASHNAHANRAAASSFFETLGINQDNSIYHQLSVDGVRALLLDIKLDGDELRLVHDPLDYGGFQEEMENNLVPFLEENEEAVVSLYLQTIGDVNTGNDEAIRAVILERLKETFSTLAVNGVPLKELTFKYDDAMWSNHNDWPTISEIVSANQRLFVFVDRSEYISSGFMNNQQVMRENDWRGIESCVSRFMWQSEKVSLSNNQQWSRLFFMNHWCCDSGADTFGTTVSEGSKLIGGGDNGWGVLYKRIKMCMNNIGGVKPNFIALDWVVESDEAKEVARFLNFGGALGTNQLCESDEDCATLSCNYSLKLCQCQECSDLGCGGCSTGDVCLAGGDGTLNECRSIESKQQDSSLQEQNSTQVQGSEIYYCGASYFDAVGNCSTGVQCPNGNGDCPDDEVCFGPFECTTDSDSESQEDQSQLSIADLLQPSLPTLEPSALLDSSSNTTISALSSAPSNAPTKSNATDPPVAPVTMYCGETYSDAKETCSDETACPGGYECPSGLICFSGVKCFTRPPSKAPTPQPTTLPPSTSPTEQTKEPSSEPTDSPVAPTKSPTAKPTFDFSNEYYCGSNYTMAQATCYTTTACPGGDPTVCEDGETCYSGIKCIAPPSVSPTLSPSFTSPTLSPVSGSENAPSGSSSTGGFGSSGTTTAPFVWPESSGETRSSTILYVLITGLHLVALLF
ncbi:hypothetical protein ACHAWO_012735 [Cyclotella atomus]|uniref:PLC-like phosphodiesterase n=1 Tax=Cyclotella atomus TaxID=382360 RepID=A0ABD3NCX1_9STRA